MSRETHKNEPSSTTKWIELIRARSSALVLQSALPVLKSQVQELESSIPDGEIYFLQHAIYDGDLAIVLVRRSGDPQHPTREGLLIAEQLRKLGSVDHAVWIPASDGPLSHRRSRK